MNKDMSKSNKLIKVVIKGPYSFDVDSVVKMIYEKSVDFGVQILGLFPLPTIRKRFTVLQSPHVDKNSRQVFGLELSRRVALFPESKNVITFLQGLSNFNRSVSIEIKSYGKGEAK